MASSLLPLLAALLASPAAALTDSERDFLSHYSAALEPSPDPCGLAAGLQAEYLRLLRAARPEQDMADVLEAVETRPGVPLRLGDGVRLAEGIAMYDAGTGTVYLSSPTVPGRLLGRGGACPSPGRLASFAHDTAAIYVHEVTHALDRAAQGPSLVETREGEVLAYARETRFLAGLPGWPPASAAAELKRRRRLRENYAKNEALIDKVKALQGKDPDLEAFGKLKGYVTRLEALKQERLRLEAQETGADPTVTDMASMLEAWKAGWPAFLEFILPPLRTRPTLTEREANLAAAREYLERMRSEAPKEAPGTLARAMLDRGVALGEQDVRFWGDAEGVTRTLEFYERRFKTVRPAPRAAP